MLIVSELEHIRLSPGQQQQATLTCNSDGQLSIWSVDAARESTGRTYNCPSNESPYQSQSMESLTEDMRTECNTRSQCTITVEYPELDDSCVVVAANTLSNNEVCRISIFHYCIPTNGKYSGL